RATGSPAALPAGVDDRASDPVDVRGGSPGPNGLDRGGPGASDERVDPDELGRRLPHRERARRIAVVPVELPAEVEHDRVALLEAAIAGLVVGRRGVGSSADDREVGPRVSVFDEQAPEIGRDLDLRATAEWHRTEIVVGPVR